MITFGNALESKFSLWLRVENPQILVAMQEAVIGVQSNILASNKLKIEEGKGLKDKKQMKEEKLPSSSKYFIAEENLDRISSLIKNRASKMSKLELENWKCLRK